MLFLRGVLVNFDRALEILRNVFGVLEVSLLFIF